MDDSERAAESYAMAFKVGAVGSIILSAITILSDTLAGLLVLAVWTLVTLFVLPWLYVFFSKRGVSFNYSLSRGPHH